jgi:hypothetical protein
VNEAAAGAPCARERTAAGHECLANLAQGTVCKILAQVGVMAKDSVGGIAMGLPLASPTARDASLHAGVQARLAQQSSDCDRSLIC